MEQKKIEEKKVYVAPEMSVVEYECQGQLLDGSNCPGGVCIDDPYPDSN